MSDDSNPHHHNPFIKRLLRNYQATADQSLDGPQLTAAVADGPLSTEPGLATLTGLGGDPHRRLETSLEGELISCFIVGGERRLCVPQIFNTVLSRFSLGEINCACDGLRIHVSLADDRQMAVLRADKVLPQSAHGCGLITQSDAQRLCACLLANDHYTQHRLAYLFIYLFIYYPSIRSMSCCRITLANLVIFADIKNKSYGTMRHVRSGKNTRWK